MSKIHNSQVNCKFNTPSHPNVQDVGVTKAPHIYATAYQVAAGTEFWSWDQVLEKVDTFKYLVRVLSLGKSTGPWWTRTTRYIKINGAGYPLCL